MKPTFIARIIFFFCTHSCLNLIATRQTQATPPSCVIAFVHLGPELPPYLADTLYQVRLFNPTTPLYLLAQETAFHTKSTQNIVQLFHDKLQVTLVPIQTLTRSQEHMLFERTSKHDTVYRKGFWKFTIQRFFVLDDFMHHYNITNLIHLENDTLLYRNIDALVPVLQKYYPGIAAPFISDTHCIASFVYINNKAALKKLTTYLAEQAQLGKNDMVLLADFKASTSRCTIDNLPIISRSYITKHGLHNARNERAHDPESYCNHSDVFQSIFDGNAIGQYLGGIDPRLGKSKPYTFINPDCFSNPALLTFEWKKDEQGRNVPFMICNGEIYPINTLHISSKNLKNFLSVER